MQFALMIYHTPEEFDVRKKKKALETADLGRETSCWRCKTKTFLAPL